MMIHNNAMVPAPEPAARIWVRAFVENDVNVKLLNGKVALHVQHDWLDHRNDDDALDQALGDGKFDVSYGLILDGAGLLVVDIDAHDGRADGFETFERLRSRIPEIGDAGLIVETGGGGRHLYFRIPADFCLRTKLREYPAIDFKTTGHVVGPGSTIGAGYRVVYGSVEDIDDAPEALIELLRRPVEVRRADIKVDGALSEQLETATVRCDSSTRRRARSGLQ
ncbi:MAG: bifunctional DNA primase/polymerase [Paracoccaceae bacterium]